MMTHEGKIIAPWVGVEEPFGRTTQMTDLGFPCTYRKSAHGAQVIADPNLCTFDICTEGDKTLELEANPDILILSYQEIINETI